MDIAKAIAKLRTDRDMTQDELAAKLYVSRDLVSKWETGARRPDRRTVERMADVFGVTPDDIEGTDDFVFAELEKCLPDNCSLTADELTALLDSFLGGLCENEADIFVQRYYFFDETADIAARFGLKENHLRTILSRTRKKLKKYITEGIHEKQKNV